MNKGTLRRGTDEEPRDEHAGGLNTGARGIGTSAVPQENRTPTLAEVGIDRKLSARSQRIAGIGEHAFEAMVDSMRQRIAGGGRVPLDIVGFAKPGPKKIASGEEVNSVPSLPSMGIDAAAESGTSAWHYADGAEEHGWHEPGRLGISWYR